MSNQERNQMRIAVNLLTCNFASVPLHLRASQYAVQSLLDSDLQDYDWRLQIVDNGSSCEETKDWLSGLASARVGVEYSPVNLGIPRGRNLGYSLLSEFRPHLAIEIHTDHIFPKRWLRPLVEAMEQYPKIGLLGCALMTSQGYWKSPVLPVNYYMEYGAVRRFVNETAEKFVRQYSRIKPRRADMPAHIRPGISHPVCKRWEMLEQIGFYHENMPGLQNFDDTEEALRAYKQGWLICVHMGSWVYHHYHFSRLSVPNWDYDFNANGAWVQALHGGDVWGEWNRTMSSWFDTLYEDK
jgi:GT2 family glycosyltransferase